ncbi:MAG: WG repeat-containing protein, partial [Clostridia bacterium]|nr:WG repeat-containing protein [Clostridia bacterium]
MAIYEKIISSIITCSLAVSIPYAAMAEKLNYVETTDAVYDEHMKVSDFCEKTNVAAVYTDGKYGFIYADGTKITEPIFSEADEPLVFDEDTALLLAADEHEKWGAVDLNGKVKVKFEYEALTYLDEKRLAAQKNGKWGIIDYNGKKTVDFKYDFISSFFDKGESGESAY